jgi:hypothetical protein
MVLHHDNKNAIKVTASAVAVVCKGHGSAGRSSDDPNSDMACKLSKMNASLAPLRCE